VVGSYSDLLLKLRTELFSCLFKNFDADALPASPADYSNLLPYFMEYTRLESERKNHAKRKKCLPAREPLAARTPRAPEDMPFDAVFVHTGVCTHWGMYALGYLQLTGCMGATVIKRLQASDNVNALRASSNSSHMSSPGIPGFPQPPSKQFLSFCLHSPSTVFHGHGLCYLPVALAFFIRHLAAAWAPACVLSPPFWFSRSSPPLHLPTLSRSRRTDLAQRTTSSQQHDRTALSDEREGDAVGAGGPGVEHVIPTPEDILNRVS